MKVALINTVDYGSTGKIMGQIAAEARSRGHEAKTFSMRTRSKKPAHADHVYYGSWLQYCLHYLLGRATGMLGCFTVAGTASLIRKLKKFQPDVIHLHNLHGYNACLPMLFSYLKRSAIPVVWTLHDCWSFTGKCPHFTMVGCDRWKAGCYDCPQLTDYPRADADRTQTLWRLKKKWFTGLDDLILVTPSAWLADMVGQSFLQQTPVKVINNGIDLAAFHPTASDFREQHGIAPDQKMILGVAFGWDERKGLDVFTELAKRLDDSFRIVLVGTSEAVDEKLPDSIVSIHRTQDQTELAQIYTAADLFLNPTREETYPTVNMEALACGTPVLTFRTGGSPEMLCDACGCVVPYGDVDVMEKALHRILTQQPYSREACLEQAKAFDRNRCFEEYVQLYEMQVNNTMLP